MNKRTRQAALAALLGLALPSAHAAWADESYDPNPPLSELNHNAGFEALGLMTFALARSSGVPLSVQNFESGFAAGQVLDDWVGLGDNRVRFGFGASLDQILWQSRIGAIDPGASVFGLTHPHGTYGNAAGVPNEPRNFIADRYFLTSNTEDGAAVPAYFVMQFERPVLFMLLTLIDYANGVGGSTHLSIWRGEDLANATQLDPAFPPESGVVPGEPDGGFAYRVANVNPRVESWGTFDFAVLRLDTPDARVGFDNLFVGNSPVPEPGTLGLLALGALLLGIRARRPIS